MIDGDSHEENNGEAGAAGASGGASNACANANSATLWQ